MLNLKKFVSLFISVTTLMVFTHSAYGANNAQAAKVAKKQIVKKNKLQFDPLVYYRLPKKKRGEYLQIFIDLAVKIDAANKKASSAQGDVYQNLLEILFPHADAAGNICLNGGVFYDKPATGCGSTVPESALPADTVSALKPYYNCGFEKRCASYFGVSSSNQGFCFSDSDGATNSCWSQSQAANGRANLQTILDGCVTASSTTAACRAFRTAMAADQAKIDQYCVGEMIAKSFCQSAKAGIASLSAGLPTTAPANGSELAGQGCNQAEINSLNAQRDGTTPAVARGRSTVDPIWYKLLNIGASGRCTGGASFEQIERKVGTCTSAIQEAVDVEGDLRSRDVLRSAVNKMTARAELSLEEKNRFQDYFGINPDEFDSVICASDTRAAMTARRRMAVSGTGERALRRNRFFSCMDRNVTLHETNTGESEWRSNSTASTNTCRFSPTDGIKMSDMIANPQKYRGKYFVADNMTGICYNFERAGRTCSDVRTQAEFSQVRCSIPPTGQASGGLVTNENGLIRLSPLHRSDYLDTVISATDFNQQYTAFELVCAGARPSCGIDNNYCRDTDGVAAPQ